MLRRETKALVGRCFNKIGEILSSSEAMDFREEIARFSSVIFKLLERTWGV